MKNTSPNSRKSSVSWCIYVVHGKGQIALHCKEYGFVMEDGVVSFVSKIEGEEGRQEFS